MTQEINRAFHGAAGKCWHEPTFDENGFATRHSKRRMLKCSHCDALMERTSGPDYCADPRLVIEVMRERGDWDRFRLVIGVGYRDGPYKNSITYISLDLIMDKTGKLARLATEWIKQKGKNDDLPKM